MLNPTQINFTAGVNPLIQGYDFKLVKEVDGSPLVDGFFHVDLAHLAVNPDGTLAFASASFQDVVTNYQGENIICKINSYGPSDSVSTTNDSPIMVFIFLDPPTNIFLS